MSSSSCTVCCDPYTKETRKMIPCFSCAYEACARCIKTFLTSSLTEPSCMNCHHVWPREFLDEHLTRSWREGDLRLHREKILFDRERSLLPATQPDVEIEVQKRTYAAEIPALVAQESHLYSMLGNVQRKIASLKRYIRNGPEAADQEKEAKEKRLFIAACPIESCRGFLSTAYKCGTCATQFCSGCRERKPKDVEHTCDPALLATIAEIVKDSRPCPRCGTAISKVSGCDQMFCTQCDTPFSYETGAVIKGIIHNPHYFERMQKLQAAAAAGGAGAEGPGEGCNGWPHWHLLPAHIRKNNLFGHLLRAAIHTEDVTLRRHLTNPEIQTDNRDLRVRYLMNELDEKKFKQLIQQRDRKRQRELEIRAVLELFVITTMEFFHNRPALANEAKANAALAAFQAQLETTMNAPLKAIGERYGNRVPLFDTTTCLFPTMYDGF